MRNSLLSKSFWLSWVRKLYRGSDGVRKIPSRSIRLGLEILEQRLTPAVIADVQSNLLILLDNPGESLTIAAASTNHYILNSSAVLAGNGLQGAVYTPSTASSGTLAITFDAAIEIEDIAPGASVTFGQSNAVAYSQGVTVALTNPLSGDINFNGTSTFAQDVSIQTVNGNINESGGATINAGGNLSLSAGNNIALSGNLNVSGGTTLQANSNVTVANEQSATGSANIVANGSITVAAGNLSLLDVGGLSNTAASASITTTAALTLDSVAVSGNLTVNAAGDITENSGLTVGGTASLTSTGGNVLMDSGSNAFGGDVSAGVTGTNNIQLANSSDITLGNISLGTGTLSVSSFGNISEDPADGISTGSASTAILGFSANGNVDLAGPNNLAAGVTIALTGLGFGDVMLRDTNANALPGQIMENLYSVNNLTLEFDNAAIAADTLPVFNNNVTLIAGGDITQTAPITVTGNASFTSTGGNITLTNTANSFNGDIAAAVSATGSNTIKLDNSAQTTTLGSIVLGKGALTVNDDSTFGFSTITEDPLTQGIRTAAGSTATVTFNVVNDTSATVDLSTAPNNLPAGVHVAVNGTLAGGPTAGDFGFRNINSAAGVNNLSFNDFSINNLTVIFPTSSTNFDVAALASLPLSTAGQFQNLAITTAGNITQTAALTVNGGAVFTVLGNTSSITLSNAGNALIGAVSFNMPATDSQNVVFANSTDITLGSSTLGTGAFQVTAGGSGNISENAGATITQAAQAGSVTLTAGGTAIDLSGGNQNFFTGQLILSGTAVTKVAFENANPLGSLASAALSLSGVAATLQNVGAILDGPVSATVLPSESINYNLDVTATDNIVLPAASSLTVTNGKSLSLTSDTGSIVLLGTLTIAGTTTLVDNGDTPNVLLATSASNSFGTLELTTASAIPATVTSASQLVLGNCNLSGPLTATAPAVSQTGGTSFLSLPGVLDSFTASSGNVALDSNTNALAIVSAAVSGTGSITLNSTSGITLDSISLGTNGNLTVNEDGASGFSSITEQSGGAITAPAGAAGTITLDILHDAAGQIDLSAGPNLIPATMTVKINGAAGGSTGDLGFRNANPLATIGQITLQNFNVNNLTVIFDNTAINYDATFPHFSGSLTLQTNGNITQSQGITATSGSFTVGGLSNTVPGDGSIILTSAANTISGQVSFSDVKDDNLQQVAFTNNGSINLGTTALGLGTFSLTANNNGNIFSFASITQQEGGGAITLGAAGSQITLSAPDNSLSGPVTLSGANVNNLQFSNQDPLATLPALSGLNSHFQNVAIDLPHAPVYFTQALDISDSLNVTAGGNIGQSAAGTLSVAGEATLSTISGNFGIQLTDTGNALHEVALSNSGQGPVALTTNTALILDGAFLGSGPVTIAASGPITQTSNPIQQFLNANDGAAGTFSLNAGANPILLDNPTNQLRGPIAVSATGPNGNVTVQNQGDVILGNDTVGGGLTLVVNNSGNIAQAPGTSFSVAGGSYFAADSGTIMMSNPGNTIGGQISLEAQAGASLQVSGAAQLATSSVLSGPLSVAAGGTISQLLGSNGPTNGVINAVGADFTSLTGAITLANAGNDFHDATLSLSAPAGAVSVTDSDPAIGFGGVLLGQVTFAGSLSITAANNVSQQFGSAITGSGQVSISNSSSAPANAFNVTLDQSGNDITGAGTFTVANVNNVTITNLGNITLAVPNAGPGISSAGDVNLSAGGQVTLPSSATLTLDSLNITAATTTIGANITTTGVGGISFVGAVNFTAAATLDSSAGGADAGITFNGNVTTSGAHALTFNLPDSGTLHLAGGTWTQGGNSMTVNGAGVTVLVDAAATFSMTGGSLNLTGNSTTGGPAPSTGNQIEVGGTFQAGGNVTITDGGSNSILAVNFNPGSVLSVGLGTVAGSLTLNGLNAADALNLDGGQLSGFGGAAPSGTTSIVTVNNGGRIVGTFSDPQDANGDILMGTDIVTPAYTPTGIAITPVAAGPATVSGNEKDGDGYTISVSGGSGLVVIAAANGSAGGLDIVVRNATTATLVTVTTTSNGGDGFTHINGIAVDGPASSAVTIAAGKSNIQTGNIYVAGTLTSLTLHDWQNGTLTAGGSASTSSSITGDVFTSVNITLGSKLSALTVAALQGTNPSSLPTITAFSFGTIKATGNAANNTPGNFEANLVDSPSAAAAVTTATVAGTLSGQWELAGSVGSVSAVTSNSFGLGVPSGANVVNGGLLTGITSVNLGTGVDDSVFATGNVATLSAISLNSFNNFQARSFGTITTTGSAATHDHGNLQAAITATGNAGGTTDLALGTLKVAGNWGGSLQINNGNVGTITVGGTVQTIVINVQTAANSGAIGTITAGAWQQGILNAKSVGTWSIVGSLPSLTNPQPAQIFGTFSGSVTLSGVSGAGAALGAFTTQGDVSDSDFLIVNGGVTSFIVGGQLTSSNITLQSTVAGTSLGTISAAQWQNDEVLARAIGTLKSTGRSAAPAATSFLTGDVTDTTVIANAGVGTVFIAGSLTSSSPGGAFMIANGGISSFTVNRAVRGYQVSTNLYGGSGGIGTLTAGSWSDSDIAAAFLGTVKITGYATPEQSGGIVNGDFTGSAVVLTGANATTHLGIGSMTVGHDLTLGFESTFTVPFGIGSLTVTGTLSGGGGEIDFALLNPASPSSGVLGALGTPLTPNTGLSAGEIQGITLETYRAGLIQSAGRPALQLNGDITSSTLAVAGFGGAAAAPVAIGALAVAGNLSGSNVDVKDGITSFKVGQTLSDDQIAAAFDHVNAGATITTLTAGSISSVMLAANSIGTLSVPGNAAYAIAGAVQFARFNLLGASAGVALGTFAAAGAVKASYFQITGGNVTSFTSAFFQQSALFVGYVPVDITSITDQLNNQQAGNWQGTFSLGTFKTTALLNSSDPADTGGFQSSDVVAGRLSTVSLTGLNAPNGALSFGVGYRNSTLSHGTLTIHGVIEPNPTVIGEFVYFGLAG